MPCMIRPFISLARTLAPRSIELLARLRSSLTWSFERATGTLAPSPEEPAPDVPLGGATTAAALENGPADDDDAGWTAATGGKWAGACPAPSGEASNDSQYPSLIPMNNITKSKCGRYSSRSSQASKMWNHLPHRI